MADPRLTAMLVIIGAVILGDPTARVAAAAPAPAVDPALEQALRSGAGRGNKLLKMTADTVRDEGCRTRTLPFLRIVGSEVRPTRVAPGATVSHRLTYALCPASPGVAVIAILTKRILSSGRVIVDEPNPSYRLRPGTWADDDQIEIPASAPAGRYTMEIDLVLGDVTQRTYADFQVE
jgi:hypothetical protein